MYCMNCGVRLAQSEARCPLCGTAAYHPALPRQAGKPTFPQGMPVLKPVRGLLPLLASIFLFLAAAVSVTVDLSMNPHISWAGYVLGSVGLFYVIFVLPGWFRHPNPVIFLFLDFAAIEVFLLCVDLVHRGGWFLSFAFPVAGILGLILVTVAALLRYVHRGVLYILGGGLMAFGGYLMLIEMFSVITFGGKMFHWSIYPLATFAAMGLFLIFTALCRPWRAILRRKFFL